MNLMELPIDLIGLVDRVRAAMTEAGYPTAHVGYESLTGSLMVDTTDGHMAAVQRSAAGSLDAGLMPVISFLAQNTAGDDVMSITIDYATSHPVLSATIVALFSAWIRNLAYA